MRTMKTSLVAAVAGMLAVAILIGGCGSTGPDAKPPLMPEDFRIDLAGTGDGEILIRWTANRERDLAGYYLYRKTSETSGYVHHATFGPDTTWYADTNLEYDITFFYFLTAFNKAHIESEQTEPVSARPANISAPAAPVRVRAVAQNIADSPTITVSWSPNTEGDLKEYRVYRSLSETVPTTGEPVAVIPRGTTIYIDTDVTEETRYYYKVTAVDRGDWESPAAPSPPVSDIPLPPPELTSPANNATATSLTPTFLWQPVPMALGYRIVVATDQTFDVRVWNKHVGPSPASVQYAGDPLESGAQYYWRVSTTTVDTSRANSRSVAWSFVAP
jgi:fibronectin type 3 domain-containing protein